MKVATPRASILARQTMVMPLNLGRFMSSFAQVRLGPSKPILKPQIQKRVMSLVGLSSVDGDTLAVGARYEDSDRTVASILVRQTTVITFYSGAVYVFTRTGTTWSQQAYIKASNTGVSD